MTARDVVLLRNVKKQLETCKKIKEKKTQQPFNFPKQSLVSNVVSKMKILPQEADILTNLTHSFLYFSPNK